jgi:hypothetical protein
MLTVRRHSPLDQDLDRAPEPDQRTLLPHCRRGEPEQDQSVLAKGHSVVGMAMISEKNRLLRREYLSCPGGSLRMGSPQRMNVRAPKQTSWLRSSRRRRTASIRSAV